MQPQVKGMWLGLAGVISFSFTLPFTRISVAELNPADVTILRIFLASVIAALLLKFNGLRLIKKSTLPAIIPVSAGVVAGFPLFTALAMQSESAGAGGVVLAILPLFTAIASSLISRTRLPVRFWFLAVMGGLLVAGFVSDGDSVSSIKGAFFLFIAAACAAVGYAAGAEAGKSMPAWEVICRALVLCIPFSLIALLFVDLTALSRVSTSVALSVLYLSLISQLAGFFLWYKGLALGGVALVSQIQLLQPVFTLMIAWVFLGEAVGLKAFVYAILIILIILGARSVLQSSSKVAENQ